MIQFNNVAKTFRRARVLDGITLNIGLGERIALIGSNGAGKTTLIRCLLGEYTLMARSPLTASTHAATVRWCWAKSVLCRSCRRH